MSDLRKKRLRAALLPTLLLAVLLFSAGCGEKAQPPEPDQPKPTAATPPPHVHEWQDGVCRGCGEICAHEWQDGVCTICGESCVHDWRDGVCTICGMSCPHGRHDPESGLCEDCGMEAGHSYLNGSCTRCGAKPIFIDRLRGVPDALTIAAKKHGKTETFHYPLEEGEIVSGPHGTVSVEDRKERDMVVYTPYGYDPEKQYNVVIMVPGAGHNAHFWMERLNRLGSAVGRVKGCELLDRLIEQGFVEPTIFVEVEYYLRGAPEEVAFYFTRDLRQRVLPFLAEHYGTYASVDERGELIAAPEHFGVAGASFGAMVCWQMLPESTDLFSYWALLAGAYNHEEEMAERINEGVSAEHPIHWLFAGDGKLAQGWSAYRNKLRELDESCACLEMDRNLSFIAVEDTSHNFSSWDIGLINSLQVFFHSRFDPSQTEALF